MSDQALEPATEGVFSLSDRCQITFDWMPYHDLAGNQIEQNTRRVLERKAGELGWERVALTQEQDDQYGLPVIEKHDRRFKDGGEHLAQETDALSERIIVQIVRNDLEH